MILSKVLHRMLGEINIATIIFMSPEVQKFAKRAQISRKKFIEVGSE